MLGLTPEGEMVRAKIEDLRVEFEVLEGECKALMGNGGIPGHLIDQRRNAAVSIREAISKLDDLEPEVDVIGYFEELSDQVRDAAKSAEQVHEETRPHGGDWFIPPEDGSKAKPRFSAKRAADDLEWDRPVARGGQTLWAFDGKAYVPGEEWLKGQIAERLDGSWKKAHRDEIINLLLDRSRPLWESPPVDRIPVANGILDVGDPREPRLEDHSPDFLSPIQIGAPYDPDATCPAIDAFLEGVVGVDAALVHEINAYLITPDNSLQQAFMYVGRGGNGKSTLIGLQESLLGTKNVSHVSLQKLEEDRFAPADLFGRLANIVADLDARALKSSSMFKAITGGDHIRAERKFRDAFDFRPFARLVFSANDPPPVADSSHAFFRRWVVVPFDRTFEPGNRDERLLEKLTTPGELSGLLNRALTALPGLRERGAFTLSERSEKAAGQFRLHADSVTGFVAERCVLGVDHEVRRPVLHGTYKAWCEGAGRSPLTPPSFYSRIRELGGIGEKTVQGVNYFTGIGVALS